MSYIDEKLAVRAVYIYFQDFAPFEHGCADLSADIGRLDREILINIFIEIGNW